MSNIHVIVQMVKRKYEGYEEGPTTTLRTTEENILLCISPDINIPPAGWEKDGWEITPLLPLTVRLSCL